MHGSVVLLRYVLDIKVSACMAVEPSIVSIINHCTYAMLLQIEFQKTVCISPATLEVLLNRIFEKLPSSCIAFSFARICLSRDVL